MMITSRDSDIKELTEDLALKDAEMTELHEQITDRDTLLEDFQ